MIFNELENTLNDINHNAKNAKLSSNGACELLHDVKYSQGQLRDSVSYTNLWAGVSTLVAIISIVVGGINLYHTCQVKETIGRRIQAEDERASGAGSKDSKCDCSIPKTP